MDPNVKSYIEKRIRELEDEMQTHTEAAKRENFLYTCCQLRIDELKGLISSLPQAIVSANIQKEIQTNNSKCTIHLDELETKRVNLFLEFMDKCGDESLYKVAKSKMPKIEYYLYRKPLWKGWDEFKADFHRWVDREGPYKGVLEK